MFSIPNLFTLLRLLLAPVIIGAILDGRDTRALVLFGVAAATDAIDGALARRYGWITKAGAYLDPVADKVLLSGVYLALALRGVLPWWFVGIVFGRDLLILACAAAALSFTRYRKFEPSVWGKLSTVLQAATGTAWLVRNVLMLAVVDTLAAALVWPTAAATVWSGLHYGWRMLRASRTH